MKWYSSPAHLCEWHEVMMYSLVCWCMIFRVLCDNIYNGIPMVSVSVSQSVTPLVNVALWNQWCMHLMALGYECPQWVDSAPYRMEAWRRWPICGSNLPASLWPAPQTRPQWWSRRVGRRVPGCPRTVPRRAPTAAPRWRGSRCVPRTRSLLWEAEA